LFSKTTPYEQTVAFQIKPYADGTDAADQASACLVCRILFCAMCTWCEVRYFAWHRSRIL